jgi:CHAD domain-containing protein
MPPRPRHGRLAAEPTTLGAVREWIAAQTRLLAGCHAGAARNGDAECIHDLRTSSRRILSLLDAFSRQLALTRPTSRRAALARLAAPLGTLRDTQVWLEFIRSRKRRRHYENDPSWPRYLEAQLRRETSEIRRLRRSLATAGWRRLVAGLRRLTDAEIPRIEAERRPTPLRPFAARTVRRSHERLLALDVPTDPDELHEFRKRCRVARYHAEDFAETLGPAVRKLARRLKAVTDALGLHHDMHVHLRRMRKEGPHAPRELVRLTERERRRAEGQFAKAWRDVKCRRFLRALERASRPHQGRARGH